jgi:F-box domain
VFGFEYVLFRTIHVCVIIVRCLVFRLMIHVREADAVEQRSRLETHFFDLPVEMLEHVLSFLDYGTIHNAFRFVSRTCEQLSRSVGSRVVFNIKHNYTVGGVTEDELRRVCDGNVGVRSLNYGGGTTSGCDTVLCDVTGVMLEYLTPSRWKHLTRLNVIGTFQECFHCSRDSNTGKRLTEILRSGVLARLTHLEVKIEPTLSCEDIIGWETPNLEVLSIATGTDWWKISRPTRFAETLTKMNALKHFRLEWWPATDPPNYHVNCRLSSRPMIEFMNNLLMPPSVESMTLTGNIKLSSLLPTWPFIKKLHVDSFTLDGEHQRLLNNFPALEELIVNGFDLSRRVGFFYECLGAYEALGTDVLLTLGDDWTVTVTEECVIRYRVVRTSTNACKMVVFKKNN